MSNNYSCTLTVQGDRLVLEEVCRKYHDSSGRVVDNSDFQLDCMEFQYEDLTFAYEGGSEGIESIVSFSVNYPSLTFIIDYDSYVANVSGKAVVSNGKIVSQKEIPREITLTIRLAYISDSDLALSPSFDTTSMAIALARELDELLTDRIRGKGADGILSLIEDIEASD